MSFVNFLRSADAWPVSVTPFVTNVKESDVTHERFCSSCVASASSWSSVRPCAFANASAMSPASPSQSCTFTRSLAILMCSQNWYVPCHVPLRTHSTHVDFIPSEPMSFAKS